MSSPTCVDYSSHLVDFFFPTYMSSPSHNVDFLLQLVWQLGSQTLSAIGLGKKIIIINKEQHTLITFSFSVYFVPQPISCVCTRKNEIILILSPTNLIPITTILETKGFDILILLQLDFSNFLTEIHITMDGEQAKAFQIRRSNNLSIHGS